MRDEADEFCADHVGVVELGDDAQEIPHDGTALVACVQDRT